MSGPRWGQGQGEGPVLSIAPVCVHHHCSAVPRRHPGHTWRLWFVFFLPFRDLPTLVMVLSGPGLWSVPPPCSPWPCLLCAPLHWLSRFFLTWVLAPSLSTWFALGISMRSWERRIPGASLVSAVCRHVPSSLPGGVCAVPACSAWTGYCLLSLRNELVLE